MKRLFLDTETTGLCKDLKKSPMDSDNWPRMVSVAYILCEDREIIESNYYIIKPKGYIIPAEAARVHGISTAKAVSEGVDLYKVLDIIKQKIDECHCIVGHNIEFDINVINAEFYRYNKTLPAHLKPHYCTMKLSKDICGLPNNKYPTLQELYSILKGKTFENAHDAFADTQAAMECFWILQDSGVLESCYSIEKKEIPIYPTQDNISWAVNRISSLYCSTARTFLTIVCNFIYNEELFSAILLTPNKKHKLIKCPQYYEVIENDKLIKKPYTEYEWIGQSFDFFNNLSKSGDAYNKMVDAIKKFEKEVGGIDVINRFNLKKPSSSLYSFNLINETDWIEIAIRSSNKKSSSLDYETRKFRNMVTTFNSIREEENKKEYNLFLETKRNLAQKGIYINTIEDLYKYQRTQKFLERKRVIESLTKPAPKSGCMVFLSLIISIGFSIFYLFI